MAGVVFSCMFLFNVGIFVPAASLVGDGVTVHRENLRNEANQAHCSTKLAKLPRDDLYHPWSRNRV